MVVRDADYARLLTDRKRSNGNSLLMRVRGSNPGRLHLLKRDLTSNEVIEYLQDHTEASSLAGEIERWRDDLIQYGIEELTDDSSDPND